VKAKNSLLSSLLILVLAFAGPASLVAAAAPAAPAQEAPAAQTASAAPKGRWNREVMIITRDASGKTVCREATPEERRNLMRPEGPRPDRVLIYPGASRRTALAKAGVADAMTTESGQNLLPSAGLDIVLHGTPQLNSNAAARDAFIVAANRWEAIISNQMTVVIDADFGPTFFGTEFSSPSVLGATGTFEVTKRFSTVRQQLLAAGPLAAEQTLYNALPATDVPTETTGGTASSTRSTRLAAPLARALGLEPDITNPDVFQIGDGDAGIGFNSAHNFDFNPNDGITFNATDFDAVVVHEIGHALGFSSESGVSFGAPTMLDMFRFRPGAANAGNLATVAAAQRVMRTGDTQVFFNNRTNTFGSNETGLSTGGPAGSQGDGEQSSHWKADEQTGVHIGIMDPTIADGDREVITDNDRLAFDTFGYRLDGVMTPRPPTPPAQPPPNNDFANAATITGSSGALSGDNFDATPQPGEPDPSLDNNTNAVSSVWYRWTAPASGLVTMDTLGSDYDTSLGAYTGNNFNALTPAGDNAQNDDIGGGNLNSRITFTATAGTTYQIMVTGWNGEVGSYKLNWVGPAAQPSVNISLAASTATVLERDGSFGALIVRTGDLNRSDQVTIQTANGTATSGGDYNGGSISLTFGPGVDRLVASFTVLNDTFVEGNETFNVNLVSTSSGALLGPTTAMQVTITDDDNFPANTTRFDNTALRVVAESGPRLGQQNLGSKVDFTVTRSGDTTQAASVDYSTFDIDAVSTKDYTFSGGTLRFAPNESSKTFSVLITEDFHNDESEMFQVRLSNPVGTTINGNDIVSVQITDDDPAGLTTNPNDLTPNFVDQNYNDFLNRHADQDGLDFWSEGITSCNGDAECIRVKRIDTSAAFFLAIEFQETSYMVHRFYKAAYGNIPNTPIPVRFQDFMRDTQEIGRGVQVGIGDWFQQLEANKAAYQLRFVQTGRFKTALPEALTPTQYVDTLNANIGNLLTADERTNLIISLTNSGNTAQARASVLRAVADNAAFRTAEERRAFVLAQYFGYLRRDPDAVGFNGEADPQFLGFNFWLTKLNEHNGDFRAAEMVKSFLESIEFRQRFGQ
jgi:hypothetical protein